uniref:G-protein coupled receptors family 3 profile domain-containing protein n=1 Tax=Periophthalmus magnuspinnatus TaxID=409849 RepID=A0A3B4AAK1_9GOBI
TPIVKFSLFMQILLSGIYNLDSANKSCEAVFDSELLTLQSEGHVIIGGLFPLHYLAPDCNSFLNRQYALFSFDFRAFRWMMTMVFAVEEINRDLSLLPGVKLGYRLLDSCDQVHTSLQSVLSLVSGCLAGSPVSYFATCTCLTNKKMYPSFLRTVPSDLFQVRGLVQLVTFLGWNWVGTIGTTDDYSHYGIQAFIHEFSKYGGCVAFHVTIPKGPSVAQVRSMADRLQSSTARVVVVFATEGQLVELFSELSQRNVTGIQWVASEAWVTASLLTSTEFHNLLEGTVGFSFPGVYIPRLKEFLQSVRPSSQPGMELVNVFWEELFDCKLKYGTHEESVGFVKKECSGFEDLNGTVVNGYTDVSQVRISYNVYKATYAISHALHRLLKCDPQKQTCELRTFTSTEPPCCFDCLPCADGEISNQSESTECIKCPQYYWSDLKKVKCVAGVEEFLSFSDTMGIILVTLTILGVSLTAVITTVFHCFRSTPIVKANNSEISFLLLAALKLCFLCSLVFIGQPSVWTCRLRQAAFGVSFVLCLSCLLVKTIVVLLAFRTNTPHSKALRLFGPIQQRVLILCTTVPQVCLCAGWLVAAPPFPFRNPDYQIVLECREPWPPGFYLVLGYIGLLAFLCLLLAFLGRKLPDTFNEAKLISFSMLIFCAVWICFIPAYVSSPGKFTVAVEIFAILASSFGLLLCIFMPKCYIILFKPERNVKKAMSVKFVK